MLNVNMRNLDHICKQRGLRLAAIPPSRVLILATFSLALTLCALRLTAQLPPNQSALVPVGVTDPNNRFVTGLDQENFVVLENGIRRPITSFYSVDSPISLAIISESPLTSIAKLSQPGDELIQTASFSDGLRQLIASKNPRKAIILATPVDTRSVPAGIQVVQADPAKLLEAAIEVRNQYLLRFQSSVPAARVEVILDRPHGLPILKAFWKEPF